MIRAIGSGNSKRLAFLAPLGATADVKEHVSQHFWTHAMTVVLDSDPLKPWGIGLNDATRRDNSRRP